MNEARGIESGGTNNQGALVFENPERGSRFALPNFEIPDLEIPASKKHAGIAQTVTVPIESTAGIPGLDVEITFTRYPNEGPGSVLLSLDLLGGSDQGRVFSFRNALHYRVRKGSKDNTPHKCWVSTNRRIEEEYEGKGLGEFGLLLIQELIRKITEKYPELSAEWLEVVTELSAIGNLVIDQSWLETHGLEKYKKRHGVNLGFVPAPETECYVAELLGTGTTRMEGSTVDEMPEKPVRFVKPLQFH